MFFGWEGGSVVNTANGTFPIQTEAKNNNSLVYYYFLFFIFFKSPSWNQMRWGLPGRSKVAAQTWRWSDISSQRLSTLGEPVQVDKMCRISLSSKSLLKTHNYRFAFMRRPLNIVLLLFLARRISFSFSPTALHFHFSNIILYLSLETLAASKCWNERMPCAHCDFRLLTSSFIFSLCFHFHWTCACVLCFT